MPLNKDKLMTAIAAAIDSIISEPEPKPKYLIERWDKDGTKYSDECSGAVDWEDTILSLFNEFEAEAIQITSLLLHEMESE